MTPDTVDHRLAVPRLRRGQDELADAFENCLIGMLIVSADGVVLRANRAVADMLGCAADECIGQRIHAFHADPDILEDVVRRLRAGEDVREFEVRLRCKNGAIRRVLLDGNALRENGGFVYSRWCLRDGGGRQQTDDADKAFSGRRLQLLWEAASVLLSANDPEAMLHGLFDTIAPHLGIDAAFNYVLNSGGDEMRLAACIGMPADLAQRLSEVKLGHALCGCSSPGFGTQMVAHIQESDDPRAELLRRQGIRSCVCNPLVSDKSLLGSLSFASRSKDVFDTEELAFLQTVCHYATLAYERLRLLNRLRDADRSKDEFLATLAHELRNTLAPICNAVQLLHCARTDDPELHWSRDMIERQVKHLSRLIDDLLDLSRISRNKLEFRRERIDLAEVVADAVESSRLLIEEQGHELTVSLPPSPVFLYGDAVRLAQVLVNLLNNAAKYTERGGHIWLTAICQEGTVELRVKDTGVGISAENLSRLFQMFFQSERSLERSQSGLGVGLSLVRHLVNRHGGTVEAHSEGLGRGSEFVVRLPILDEQDMPPPPPAAEERTTSGAARVHRILVVDDNRDAADSLAMLLRLRGKDVHTAYDGLEAVEASARLRPDAIVLDIGMPNMNGHEACLLIRGQTQYRPPVIIALTGWDQPRDRLRIEESGFDAYVVKPVDPTALLELVDTLQEQAFRRSDAGTVRSGE